MEIQSHTPKRRPVAWIAGLTGAALILAGAGGFGLLRAGRLHPLPSGADAQPPSNRLGVSGVDFRCALPLTMTSSGGAAGAAPVTIAGTLSLPDGGFRVAEVGFRPDPATTFDGRAGRWLPVGPGMVSPDHRRYVYARTVYTEPGGSAAFSIHVASVDGGGDRVVYQAEGTEPPHVMGWVAEGILISRPGARGAAAGTPGVEYALVDPAATPARTRPVTLPGADLHLDSWTMPTDAGGQTVLWRVRPSLPASAVATTGGVGGVAGLGPPEPAGPDVLERARLGSAVAEEVYRPAQGWRLTLSGNDGAGHPVIRVQPALRGMAGANPAQRSATLAGPSAVYVVFGPGRIEPLDLGETGAWPGAASVTADSHGLWVVKSDLTLWLQPNGKTGIRVADLSPLLAAAPGSEPAASGGRSARVAGPCL